MTYSTIIECDNLKVQQRFIATQPRNPYSNGTYYYIIKGGASEVDTYVTDLTKQYPPAGYMTTIDSKREENGLYVVHMSHYSSCD
jgi:hypothetical protein